MTTLKNILLLNGLSSGLTGLGLVVFAPYVAELFEVQSTQAFYSTGIFLLVFGAMVLNESRKTALKIRSVTFICILDILWVVVSADIVLFRLFALSQVGYILIGAVALWVAAMACLQVRGMKQLAV